MESADEINVFVEFAARCPEYLKPLRAWAEARARQESGQTREPKS